MRYRESSPSTIFLGIALSVPLSIYIYITLYQYTNIFPPICHSFPRICHYNSSHCTSTLDPILYPIVYPINIPHYHSSRCRHLFILYLQKTWCVPYYPGRLKYQDIATNIPLRENPVFCISSPKKVGCSCKEYNVGPPPSYRLVYKPH